MSGSGYMRAVCMCAQTHSCLGGTCNCFQAELSCTHYCMCNANVCQNTEDNRAEVELRYQAYLDRKTPPVATYPGVPPVTSYLKQGDTNTEPRQGGAGGVSNVPDEVVQITSSSSSMDEQPVQMEEQPTQSGDNRGSDQNKQPPMSDTSSSVFRMSGSGYEQTMCSCLNCNCLHGNCYCFKDGILCSKRCSCHGCKNTENNKAEIKKRHRLYLRRTSPSPLVVTPGGLPVPPGFSGCTCKKIECATANCFCLKNNYRCTSKCKCQDCANPNGPRGSDTNTEPRQGGAGGVSNVPEEVVQTTHNLGTTGAEEQAQMGEQHTQSRDNWGSGQNKRARN